MADAVQATVGNNIGFVDKRQTQGLAASAIATNNALYGSRSTLKAAVQAGDAGTYTDTYVKHMTFNDLVYATRKLNDNAGI